VVSLLLLGLPAHATVGARPPAFTLRSAPGAPWRGTFRLADHLGRRPVLIHFFATWCHPCELEMAAIEKLRGPLESQGLVVVGVSVDDAQSAAGVGPMARRLRVGYPVVVDADSSVAARLDPRRVCPYTILVHRNGTIAREQEGWSPEHAERLAAELGRLVSP
jgi:peroxiredoxin